MAHDSFSRLADAARRDGSIAEAALAEEQLVSGETREALRVRMAERLAVMREAVSRGLSGDVRSRSGVIAGDAARLCRSGTCAVGGVFARALAAALAVAEVNASMGRVVAAPTGGASGVVPGVIITLADEHGVSQDAVVDALFTASAVGAVLAAKTNLSGAAAGCQAEIGAAVAMAAAGGCEMLGGTPDQVEAAASIALQGLLGLVCDPAGGLVEVPCVMRNATATGVALSGIELALAGVVFPIPLDDVAAALASIGRALPASLRETAQGGLAITPAARELYPPD